MYYYCPTTGIWRNVAWRSLSAPAALTPNNPIDRVFIKHDEAQGAEATPTQQPTTAAAAAEKEEPLYRPISELHEGSTRDYPSERTPQPPIGTRRPQGSQPSDNDAPPPAASQQPASLCHPQPQRALHTTVQMLQISTDNLGVIAGSLCGNTNMRLSRFRHIFTQKKPTLVNVADHVSPSEGIQYDADELHDYYLPSVLRDELDLEWEALRREIEEYGASSPSNASGGSMSCAGT